MDNELSPETLRIDMDEQNLVKRLESLIPDLKECQEVHREWRDCDQIHRDNNPNIGDENFHNEMVDTYENRILTVKDAIKEISGLKEQLSHCEDSITKYIQSTSELLERLDRK